MKSMILIPAHVDGVGHLEELDEAIHNAAPLGMGYHLFLMGMWITLVINGDDLFRIWAVLAPHLESQGD